ncbi:SERINE PROTEASE FAMILY S10 SERINE CARBOXYPEPTIDASE [Salix purpurea]|uniref:SERINE PROTEASE FAMILY S10 SERINE CARBOXYPEPTIDASE n=1 Tax=Salix purpurea TaxID=77065 RepID=A0A9Q0Q2P0_SALPP|nr:SERINE PROTEASE FAMILY S10 SERINE CARBOXYPEPTIDASE [Salix purpurea]
MKLQNSTIRLKNTLLRRRVSGYDPCTEKYAEKYYNRPEVQKAMHANVTGIPYKWTACSDVLIKNWKDSESSMLPVYKELIAAGLRIWVFSGDTDSVVPVTATRFSLSHLNLPVKTRWYPWYSGDQMVTESNAIPSINIQCEQKSFMGFLGHMIANQEH